MNIQPTSYVQLPLESEANQLEIIVNSFPLFPSEITVIWKLYGEAVSKEGILVIPQSIIDVWGTDDTVVKEYVLQQLDLTAI
ncbi:hypothetical protein EBQ81_01065 [bacterium]|nr:hypothetical protein [bacterium]